MNILKKIKGLVKRVYVPDSALRIKIWGETIMLDSIEKAFRDFGVAAKPRWYRRLLKADMLRAYGINGVTPSEYFLFGYDKNKDQAYRNRFLTVKQKDTLCMEKIGIEHYRHDLCDKYHFYELCKPYFHREVMKLTASTSEAEFQEFAARHGRVIIKPLTGQCGRGTFIYEAAQPCTTLAELMVDGAEFIVEEVVRQHPFFAAYNASSVNTLRIPSIMKGGKATILQPYLRTGRAGYVVDNVIGGGILALIDKETGTVTTNGYDEVGRQFEKHPDSGQTYKGAQIPRWQELLEYVQELHGSLPGLHRYVGFDLALNERNEWCVIEGNWGEFGGQLGTGVPVRAEFEELMRD